MTKVPYNRYSPQEGKQARQVANPEITNNQTISWQINIMDYGGRWGWDNLTDQTVKDHVLERIKNFETMTWQDIFNTKSHPIPTNRIIREAQKRLQEIKQDDAGELFSLRVRGLERIWGIRDGRVFKILWWDPQHEVCPSPKKHT